MDEAKRVWEETRTIIRDGIQLTITNKGVSTNFPQSQKNPPTCKQFQYAP